MKRVMILLICAALGLSHAYGQFTVGAKAGLNVASIGNVTVYPSNPLPGDLKSWTLEYGYLPGAHVGGYARYDFSPLFSVQTELLYSQMGYKISVPAVDLGGHVYDNVTGRMRMHYLNLPVLFRLTVPGSGLFAEVGPQPGLLLGSHGSIRTKNGERVGEVAGVSGPATTFDLSGVAGLGYRWKNGLAFSAHYVHEFKTSKKEFIPRMTRKYAVQLSVAYDIKTF